MADNNLNNEKTDLGENQKVKHLDEIFDDMETYDYEPSGSLNIRTFDPDPSAAASSRSTASAPRRRADSASASTRSAQSQRQARNESAGRSSRSSHEAPSRRSTSAERPVRSSSSDRPVRSSSGDRPVRSSSGARTGSGNSVRRSAGAPSNGERRPSPNGRSRQNSIRRRKKKFKKLLLIYIAALIVILIVGSIIFSIYLGSYENGLPSHVAEAIVNDYSSQEGIVGFVTQNADKTTIIDNIEDTANVYATNIAGKSISYIENSDFRASAPSYDIIADGATVAKVTLGHEGNSSKWTVTSLNISDYLPNSMSVSIHAPAGSTVTVNDRTLDASYITATGVPEILQNSLKFISNPPQYDTYRLSGLVTDPTVKVTDASGTALDVTAKENDYFASMPADEAFIASVEDRVYAAIDSYATYFINMSFDLKNYITLDSDLWVYIFGSDTMDPIATSLYMFEDIQSYDFIERSAGNYVRYTDDCFTVDIKYALDMVFTNPAYSDDNQKMDATWVFVIDSYDGSWCISDIINH